MIGTRLAISFPHVLSQVPCRRTVLMVGTGFDVAVGPCASASQSYIVGGGGGVAMWLRPSRALHPKLATPDSKPGALHQELLS